MVWPVVPGPGTSIELEVLARREAQNLFCWNVFWIFVSGKVITPSARFLSRCYDRAHARSMSKWLRPFITYDWISSSSLIDATAQKGYAELHRGDRRDTADAPISTKDLLSVSERSIAELDTPAPVRPRAD
jgi:hypothetical protein